MTTKSELPDRPDGTFLTCEEHPWVRFSSYRSDYFWAADNDEFPCPECGESMVLAKEHRTLEVCSPTSR